MNKQLDEKTLTPAELKKREEVAQALERDDPGMDMGKKMAIATSVAKRVAEKVEKLDELSMDTIKSYKEKVATNPPPSRTTSDILHKAIRRFAGKERAEDRIHHDEMKKMRARLGIKEEFELDESAVVDHMKGKQKPYVSSDGKGNYEVLGNMGQTKMTFSRAEHGKDAHLKAQKHLKSKYNEYMKEELELDEAEAPLKHHSALVSYTKKGDPHRKYEARFKTTHNLGKDETHKRAVAAFAAKGRIVYNVIHEEVELDEAAAWKKRGMDDPRSYPTSAEKAARRGEGDILHHSPEEVSARKTAAAYGHKHGGQSGLNRLKNTIKRRLSDRTHIMKKPNLPEEVEIGEAKKEPEKYEVRVTTSTGMFHIHDVKTGKKVAANVANNRTKAYEVLSKYNKVNEEVLDEVLHPDQYKKLQREHLEQTGELLTLTEVKYMVENANGGAGAIAQHGGVDGQAPANTGKIKKMMGNKASVDAIIKIIAKGAKPN